MPSFWSKIYYAFGWMTLSTDREPGLSYYPEPGHNRPHVIQDEPGIDMTPDGPEFFSPPVTEGEPFKCNYKAMKGYQRCSTENDRGCWIRSDPRYGKVDYDINTDYDRTEPKGIERPLIKLFVRKNVLAPIEGQAHQPTIIVDEDNNPYPWIQACWGDTLTVEVKNELEDNGTTIHWHGIRMHDNCLNDGVNAITQCPIAPGKTFTYKFKARQYGTSWYHSHYGLQYGDGALGALTIHGPSSARYDVEVPPLMIADFSRESFFDKWRNELKKGKDDPSHRTLDGIMLNNFGIAIDEDHKDKKRHVVKFQRGKRHLLRLINHSVEATFVFSIDDHRFQVISTDFVPIEPYWTDHIVIGIGQRYNIIVEGKARENGNEEQLSRFWIRTELARGCEAGLKKEGGRAEHYERTGVVEYDEDKCKYEPWLQSCKPEPLRGGFGVDCRDEPFSKLRPVVRWQIGRAANTASSGVFDVGLDKVTGRPFHPGNKNLTKWNMYSDTMWLNFDNPTLKRVLDGEREWKGDYDSNLVIVNETTRPDSWMYFLISGNGVPVHGRQYVPVAHPIHLHGHDFALLQQSDEPFKLDNLNLQLDNPPRRDVVLLPSKGFVVVAFKADNPGIWLMHCHIAWHASGGLAMQLLENWESIRSSFGDSEREQMKTNCKNWNEWRYPKGKDKDGNPIVDMIEQDDSGI